MFDFKKFIADNKQAVFNACKGTGFLPSVMLGQNSLEASGLSGSQYGYHKLSYLAYKYNNFSGIKYRPWMAVHGVTESPNLNTVEHTKSGAVVAIKPTWAVFKSYEHCVSFKIIMLKRVSVYRKNKVFEATTPLEQLNRLWDNGNGYATDRTYPQKVMAIINAYNLTALDAELKKKVAIESSIKILPQNGDYLDKLLRGVFRMKNIVAPVDTIK